MDHKPANSGTIPVPPPDDETSLAETKFVPTDPLPADMPSSRWEKTDPLSEESDDDSEWAQTRVSEDDSIT